MITVLSFQQASSISPSFPEETVHAILIGKHEAVPQG